MTLTITNIILLIGAAQAFLLSMLIYHKHLQLYPNRFLGTLMLFYGIVLLNLLIQDSETTSIPRTMMLVISGLSLTISPLHFLYTKYVLHPSKRLSKFELWHLLPLGLYEGAVLLNIFLPSDPTREIFSHYPAHFLLFNWILLTQGFVYMYYTLRGLRRFDDQIKLLFSSIEHRQLTWLQNITYLSVNTWIVFGIENFCLTLGYNVSNFTLSSVFYAVYVYIIGYLGLIKSDVLSSTEFTTSTSLATEVTEIKYEKSGLSAEAAEEYETRLLELMNSEHPYTNSDLTLNLLAEKMGITSHNLSEVMNTRLNQNFYDFINHYRIEQVKKDLSDPGKKHLKILSIAFDAGFSSKTTFNTIFKSKVMMTPSEYRKRSLTDENIIE